MKYELTHPLATFERASAEDAGFDLRACMTYSLTLGPNESQLVPVGVKLDMRGTGYYAELHPRSGLGSKGLVLGNLTGIIDGGYTKEIRVCLWNRTGQPMIVQPGDRVAQLVFKRLHCPDLVQGTVDDSERGGFGSTGVQ